MNIFDKINKIEPRVVQRLPHLRERLLNEVSFCIDEIIPVRIAQYKATESMGIGIASVELLPSDAPSNDPLLKVKYSFVEDYNSYDVPYTRWILTDSKQFIRVHPTVRSWWMICCDYKSNTTWWCGVPGKQEIWTTLGA